MEPEVERYRKPTRVLHWVHAGAFSVLFLTGLVLFIPGLGFLAEGGWTRLLHRIAAAAFVIAPAIYVPLNWTATLRGIKDAFNWGREDIGWALAAPRYYFFCDEGAMPPQDHMNTGQKMWWLLVLILSGVFLVTGLVMWLFKTVAPPALLQVMVLLHDVAFIGSAPMLFVHIYLSAIHPLMRPARAGAWSSMARGRVSRSYARSHHARWYARVYGTGEPAREKETEVLSR